MFMDVAFADVRDSILDGDTVAKVELVCAGRQVEVPITRASFALSVSPVSVALTEMIIRALDVRPGHSRR